MNSPWIGHPYSRAGTEGRPLIRRCNRAQSVNGLTGGVGTVRNLVRLLIAAFLLVNHFVEQFQS